MAETTIMESEQATRIASWLPKGYALEHARLVDVVGTVEAPSIKDVESAAAVTQAMGSRLVNATAVLAEVRQGGPSMINSDGKPTIMKVKAWMVHSGFPNLNGDAFIEEELKALTPGLFKAPNFGVMDWNHSAVLQWNDDPVLIGVWYDAEWGFNPLANDGKGANGIQVTGMVFSWLFPDQANEMLADQARDGVVRFSMACIPQSLEFGKVDGRHAAILHNPVFFTNSALNKPNADPQANGRVSEDPEITPADLKQELTGTPALATTAGSGSLVGTLFTINGNGANGAWLTPVDYNPSIKIDLEPLLKAAAALKKPEDTVMDETLEKIKAEKVAAEKVAEELANKYATAETASATLKADNEKLTAEKTAAETAKVAAETQVAELTTAKEALAAELKTAQESLTKAAEEIETLKTKLAEIEAVEAAKVAKDKLVARLAELPEAYAEAHAKRSEESRKRIEESWMKLSDEEWELKKEELFGGFPTKVGMVDRSKAEGNLATVDKLDGNSLKAEITAMLK